MQRVIDDVFQRLSNEGLRVLGLAVRRCEAAEIDKIDEVENVVCRLPRLCRSTQTGRCGDSRPFARIGSRAEDHYRRHRIVAQAVAREWEWFRLRS